MPVDPTALGAEIGAGVFGVRLGRRPANATASDRDEPGKVVAFVHVVLPVGGTPGTETWFTVNDPGTDSTMEGWQAPRNESGHDPMPLFFDWAGVASSSYTPTTASGQTYQKYVHTVTAPVPFPEAAKRAAAPPERVVVIVHPAALAEAMTKQQAAGTTERQRRVGALQALYAKKAAAPPAIDALLVSAGGFLVAPDDPLVVAMLPEGFTLVPEASVSALPEPPRNDGAPVRDAPPNSGTPWHLASTRVRSVGNDGRHAVLGLLDSRIAVDAPELSRRGGEKSRVKRAREVDPRTLRVVRQADYVNHSHASVVASLAVGARYGAAPKARVVSCAVLTEADGDTVEGDLSQVIVGLDWLTDADARNGPPIDVLLLCLQVDDESEEAQTALEYAIDNALALRPLLYVGAAGNQAASKGSARPPTQPGRHHYVLSVGAHDVEWNAPAWSRRGSTSLGEGNFRRAPDVYAPGVDVPAPDLLGYENNANSGTSTAAALVAGLALRLTSSGDWSKVRRGILACALRPVTGDEPRKGIEVK